MSLALLNYISICSYSLNALYDGPLTLFVERINKTFPH